MPAYNAEQYIKAAIESILTQTSSDFEFIIVDDGLTDGTAGIIRRFARDNSRIRVVRNDNNIGVANGLKHESSTVRVKYIAGTNAGQTCRICENAQHRISVQYNWDQVA